MSFHIVMFISLLLPYLCCLWPAGGKSKVPLQYFGPSGNAARSGNIQAMQLFHSATRSQLLDCIDLAFSTQFRVALTSKAPPWNGARGRIFNEIQQILLLWGSNLKITHVQS